MQIDFTSIPEQRVPGFKGGEGTAVLRMYSDDSVKIIRGYLEKNSTIGMHAHIGSSETVYILGGSGKMVTPQGEEPLGPGSVSYCPEGQSHSLVNTGEEPLQFLGVVPTLK